MTTPPPMTIEIDQRPEGIVVRPIGDVDLSRSSTLRQRIAEVNGRRPARVVVDLSDVPYMDSSGVATLVEALQVGRKQGTRLALCSLQPRVRSVFEIARLDTVFDIHADRDAALAAP